jgi:acyl-CoA synthetase
MKQAIGDMIRRRAQRSPDAVAYLGEASALSWAGYDRAADILAGQLAGLCRQPGDRVAVYLPDGPLLHVAYTACERAGLVIVGIPARAGDLELDHLIARTGARVLLCPPRYRDRTGARLAAGVRARGVPLEYHAELAADGTLAGYDAAGDLVAPRAGAVAGRQLGPDDLWLLNSTSGTTGLPKCVEQVQDTWTYLAGIAATAADLGPDDVILSVVPSPYGFGLWTAHMLPALLGVPCVLRERFSAEDTLRALAEHRVTMLACVTTQLRMMLASPVLDEVDLTALRVVYTGGERTPPERAREWERRTGSAVLQFYGSNETGAFSCTTLADDEELRLTTVGRVVPGTEYRIYDSAGNDVTAAGGPGQPASRGPAGGERRERGYWDDDAANAELFGQDGFKLLPDVVTVDAAGYVRIAGRKADLIIRGGKNISAAAVEEEVGAHPAVDLVAVIAVPDAIFGERVCAVVTTREPGAALTLDDLLSFLAARGLGKEYFPEYLAVLPEMPVSAGGKIAKNALKARLPDLVPSSGRGVRCE